MVLCRLARRALSGKIVGKRLAALLRHTVLFRRDQCLVLPNAFGRNGACLAARYPARFSIRLEGIEIHDALEAAVADLCELDRADADAAASARPQAWRRFVSAAASFSQRYRPIARFPPHVAGPLPLRVRISR